MILPIYLIDYKELCIKVNTKCEKMMSFKRTKTINGERRARALPLAPAAAFTASLVDPSTEADPSSRTSTV